MFKTLRIQLTDECNLRCFYCCHEGTANDFSILTDKNLIQFIRASYDVLKIQKVKFTGGEPLAYDGKISKIINSVNRDAIQFSIVTNATKYSRLIDLANYCPNMEFTISLPVPPEKEYYATYKSITGCVDERKNFYNVINSVEYLTNCRRHFKVNYVLCNNVNTSKEYIKLMIEYALQNTYIQLRFLEMAVNSTNNDRGRIIPYVFSQLCFEQVLSELGYRFTKEEDKRSSCLYLINGCTIKFIKFFCDFDCTCCPDDKTTLWLTSTGKIKDCSFRNLSTTVDNWQYTKMTRLLENFLQ